MDFKFLKSLLLCNRYHEVREFVTKILPAIRLPYRYTFQFRILTNSTYAARGKRFSIHFSQDMRCREVVFVTLYRIRNALFFYEHDTAHNEDLDQVFQSRYDFKHFIIWINQ